MDNKDIDFQRWSEIVIERWEKRISRLKIVDTGTLRDTFNKSVMLDADGDLDKVSFTFKLYGWYVDAGVGKGYSRGNGGDLGFSPLREPRRWYFKTYRKEVNTLRRLMIAKNAEMAMVYLLSIEKHNLL